MRYGMYTLFCNDTIQNPADRQQSKEKEMAAAISQIISPLQLAANVSALYIYVICDVYS